MSLLSSFIDASNQVIVQRKGCGCQAELGDGCNRCGLVLVEDKVDKDL